MAHQYAERQSEHEPRAVPAEDADGAHAEVLEQRAEAQQVLVRMKEKHPDLSDRRQHDVVLQLYRDKLQIIRTSRGAANGSKILSKRNFIVPSVKPPRGMSRAAGISVYLAVFVNRKSNTWS